MAYDIGPKIGIEGEAEFRKELSNINQNIKTLGSEMKSVVSAFEDGAASEEAMAAKTDVLTRQIDAQKDKIAKLTEGLEKSSEKFGDNDTKTLKWKQAVYEATAQLNKMEKELEDTGKEVDDVSDSMKDGEKATLSFSDVLKANLLGDAIKSGLSAIANGVKEIAGSMKDAVVESAAYADEILTLSTNTGLSTDTLQELSYMAELTDTSLETITGSMAKLTRNMATAQKGTGDAAKAFAELGVDIVDSSGALRNNEDVFTDVIGALSAMENETQRDAYAMQIFGRSAQDLNSFMAKGADGIAALAEEAHNVGYVLDEEALSSLGSVDDAMQRFDSSIGGLKNQIITGFAPAIATGIESLNSFLAGESSAQEFASTMSDMLMEGARAILDNLPAIMDTVGTLLTELFNGVRDAFPEIIEVATEVIGTLLDGLIDGLPDILQGGFDMLMALVDGLIEAIPGMIERLPEIITNIVLFFANNVPKIVDSGIKLIGGLITGLLRAIPQMVKNLPQIIKAIVDGLKSGISSITEVGKNIVQGVWNGIQQMGTWIKNKVKNFFGGIVDSVKGLLGIHSPSRVFAGIGENMAAGIGVGFGSEFGAVQKQVDRSMSNLVPDVTASVGMSASSGSAGSFGGGGVFSVSDLKSALFGMGIYMSGQKVGELTNLTQKNNSRAYGMA